MRAESAPGGALLLAAGVGRRFGSDKRRHPLEDGTAMLLGTLAVYVMAFERVAVVLRPEDDMTADVRARFPAVLCISAPLAHLGMGNSLAAGTTAVSAWPYLFVGLADMPFILPQTLIRLRDTLEEASQPTILQPLYEGTPGHPVGFHQVFFSELQALTGDQGARRLIEGHRGALLQVETKDPGVIKDIDTPP